MKSTLLLLTTVVTFIFSTAQAQYAPPEYVVGGENWFAGQDQQKIYADSIVPGRSTVILFRQPDNALLAPIAIHLNGDYQGSLISEGGYTVAALCSAKNTLSAGVGTSLNFTDFSFNLEPSQISYFKVSANADKSLTIQQVSTEEGAQAAETLPRMTHTISRLKQRHCLTLQ